MDGNRITVMFLTLGGFLMLGVVLAANVENCSSLSFVGMTSLGAGTALYRFCALLPEEKKAEEGE